MSYRPYYPPAPLLFGYDPFRDLPLDHLARLVEDVVEETVVPPRRDRGPGQPQYDPRLCVKVLVYSYCTGVRSSRVMARGCRENLPLLFLTRGDAPSYHTLCTARTEQGEFLEAVWEGLFSVAAAAGIERVGRITLDSTKLRANASPEAVLTRAEYAAVRAELERIQAEVERIEAQEAAEGSAGRTELGRTVPQEHMRDILRRVRRQRRQEQRPLPAAAPPETLPLGAGGDGGDGEPGNGEPGTGEPGSGTLPLGEPAAAARAAEPVAPCEPMSLQMLHRVAAGLKALQEAEADGRKQLCLTDPDARMMYGERERRTREGHSFEVAVDNGLLVAGQSTQENHDNARLTPLVATAQLQEPAGVRAVDADSGYYGGTAVATLLRAGLDTCIPDSSTAGDLHRGQPIGTTQGRNRGSVPFTYDAATDTYHCPEGNVLGRTQHRHHGGQEVTVYRAQAPCVECPLRADCLTQAQAKHRTLKVADDHELLEAARQRFGEAEQQDRYHHRGEKVETVFGFLRGTLGYHRWLLRGAKKVACEAQLFKNAYQFRKVHRMWAG